MDTNHRGGAAGFVRVVSNDENEVALIYPECKTSMTQYEKHNFTNSYIDSGNRLYQTLGNLYTNPLVGVVFPDFETSDALFLTGTASILVGNEASSILARTNLAVKITVSGARFVKGGLPFQGTSLDTSPYNPPIRYLLSERAPLVEGVSGGRSKLEASLVKREVLTPTINRFTLKLSSITGKSIQPWHAGQHLTLDFDEELSSGYAHMNDDDPQLLNEDFVRTFTISSPPPAAEAAEMEIQLTLRKNGRATNFLWRHNERVPLELPVLGFGGEETFRMPIDKDNSKKSVFVAGGVGVTPLLAQAQGVLDGEAGLEVLWSISKDDIALATDTIKRIPKLASVAKLFVTGGEADLEELRGLGVNAVEARRMDQGDLEGLRGENSKFFLCAGTGLLNRLKTWLDGEEVVWEDFGY